MNKICHQTNEYWCYFIIDASFSSMPHRHDLLRCQRRAGLARNQRQQSQRSNPGQERPHRCTPRTVRKEGGSGTSCPSTCNLFPSWTHTEQASQSLTKSPPAYQLISQGLLTLTTQCNKSIKVKIFFVGNVINGITSDTEQNSLPTLP